MTADGGRKVMVSIQIGAHMTESTNEESHFFILWVGSIYREIFLLFIVQRGC